MGAVDETCWHSIQFYIASSIIIHILWKLSCNIKCQQMNIHLHIHVEYSYADAVNSNQLKIWRKLLPFCVGKTKLNFPDFLFRNWVQMKSVGRPLNRNLLPSIYLNSNQNVFFFISLQGSDDSVEVHAFDDIKNLMRVSNFVRLFFSQYPSLPPMDQLAWLWCQLFI